MQIIAVLSSPLFLSLMINILIIEDNKDTADVLSEYLSANGFHTETAVNGKDATSKFKQKSFDVMLTDYILPDMDGIEVVKKCRRNDVNLKVIFLSAYNLDQEIIQDTHTYVLEKPCRPAKILTAIQNITR